MAENQVNKTNSRQDQLELLRAMQKKLIMRAVLIVAVVLLTGVSFFALTAAWYTNIVGTGGLSFSAKQWNFSGKVTLINTAVNAAPGDSGIIPLTIENSGTEMAVASIMTSKQNFSDPKMQQRIYFYVDAPLYRNGERMERVYISAYSSYTYTLFPQSTLILSQERQDSYLLQWQWVYDVVGYYVMGQQQGTDVVVHEYMRPIEYDFDIFKTTFDDQGNLLTIDGSKTAAALLKEVSETDGYEGTIHAASGNINGYYPVSVNADGYGVWAYLCTKDQILENSNYDTQVGTGENNPSCPVTITVTGANSNGGAMEVSDPSTLAAILTTSSHASVKLTQDIRLTQQVVLPEGARIEIDLDGHTLSSTSGTIFTALEGSKLTINGGSDLNEPGVLQGTSGSYGIHATGAEVELNNVRVTGVQEGIIISDDGNSSNRDSTVRIVDCYIDASDDALWIFGNDGDGSTYTTVIVERCTLIGRGYVGVLCHGTYRDINITISDSEIVGHYAGVFHPQSDSTLTLRNCKITGTADAGVVVKGGTVNIISCEIEAQGPYVDTLYDNGFGDSGVGVYIEANYEWNVTVNITGSVITSHNAEAIRLTEAENYTYDAKFVIAGSKFISAVTANNSPEPNVPQLDGTIPPEYMAEGYTGQEIEDGDATTTTYMVIKITP